MQLTKGKHRIKQFPSSPGTLCLARCQQQKMNKRTKTLKLDSLKNKSLDKVSTNIVYCWLAKEDLTLRLDYIRG